MDSVYQPDVDSVYSRGRAGKPWARAPTTTASTGTSSTSTPHGNEPAPNTPSRTPPSTPPPAIAAFHSVTSIACAASACSPPASATAVWSRVGAPPQPSPHSAAASHTSAGVPA
ncbi:hypothetical protein SGLAM104S_10002 [Streptomyces glaucescens]